MIELLTIVAVLLALVLVFICFIVWCEFRHGGMVLEKTHSRLREAMETCDDWRRRNHDLQSDIREKNGRIDELEIELARLNEFRNAVVAANAALDEDEE